MRKRSSHILFFRWHEEKNRMAIYHYPTYSSSILIRKRVNHLINRDYYTCIRWGLFTHSENCLRTSEQAKRASEESKRVNSFQDKRIKTMRTTI